MWFNPQSAGFVRVLITHFIAQTQTLFFGLTPLRKHIFVSLVTFSPLRVTINHSQTVQANSPEKQSFILTSISQT